MLKIIILLALFSVPTSQLQKVKTGQYYSNIQYEDFSNRSCGNIREWIVSDYKTGEVVYRSNNTKYFKASTESCASSPLITFTSLEVNAYLRLISNENGLNITVYNEFDVPIVRLTRNKLSVDYKDGWNTIKFRFKHNIFAYVSMIFIYYSVLATCIL